MNEQVEREAFGKWAGNIPLNTRTKDSGEYAIQSVAEAWEAWKARAAIQAIAPVPAVPSAIAADIVMYACEADPADPTSDQCIRILPCDLQLICETTIADAMLSAAPQPAQQVAKPIPDAVEWYGGVKTDEEIDQQVARKPLFVEMIAEHPGLREEIEQQDAQQEPAQDEPVVWLNKTAEDKRRCYASTNEHQYLHEAAVLEHAAREISNLFTRPQASNPLKNETELRNSYFIARQAPNTGAVTVRGSAFIELYEAARNIKDKP
jgi:hypothetical protein